jgi:NAD(P)-dependent dehydrogenase (short-subunit alcohol dehydrogenase family)
VDDLEGRVVVVTGAGIGERLLGALLSIKGVGVALIAQSREPARSSERNIKEKLDAGPLTPAP